MYSSIPAILIITWFCPSIVLADFTARLRPQNWMNMCEHLLHLAWHTLPKFKVQIVLLNMSKPMWRVYKVFFFMESLMSRKTVFEMFRRVFWSSMEGIDGIDELVKFLFARWSGVDTVIEEPFVKVRFWSLVLREKFVFEVAYKKVAVVTSRLGSHSTKMTKMLPNYPNHSFFTTWQSAVFSYTK